MFIDEANPFSRFLDKDDSPLDQLPEEPSESLPNQHVDVQSQQFNNTTYEDKERNRMSVIEDALTFYDGRTNPLNGQVYDFSSMTMDEFSQRYSRAYSGLLLSEEEYNELIDQIESKLIPYGVYRALISSLCEKINSEEPDEDVIKVMFEQEKDPVKAYKEYIGQKLFYIDADLLLDNFAKISDLTSNENLARKWESVIQKLGVGEVGLNDLVSALIDVFPELNECKNVDQVQEIFWEIKFGMIMRFLTSSDYSLSNKNDLHSIISGRVALDAVVERVSKQ